MSEVALTGATGEEESSPLGSVPTAAEDEAAEFKRKVDALVSMMNEDAEVRDRIIAETYVNIANIEAYVRTVATVIQSEGIGGMLRGMRKRG